MPGACDKCRRRNPVSFHVEPEEAFRTVVLNRWRIIRPSCFDAEAEKAGVCYRFVDLDGMSWSERPAPLRGQPQAIPTVHAHMAPTADR